MPVKYSDQIKKPKAELEYSPENIKELSKCKKDLTYFIKYVKIVNPDRGEELYSPYDYQKELLEMYSKNRYNVILASRQSGKCCLCPTIIKIKNKKTGNIEDITIGDFFNKIKK